MVECLLYARHVLEMRRTEMKKTVRVPALMQLIFSCKKINKRGREKKREKRKKIRVVGAEKGIKGRWWMA